MEGSVTPLGTVPELLGGSVLSAFETQRSPGGAHVGFAALLLDLLPMDANSAATGVASAPSPGEFGSVLEASDAEEKPAVIATDAAAAWSLIVAQPTVFPPSDNAAEVQTAESAAGAERRLGVRTVAEVSPSIGLPAADDARVEYSTPPRDTADVTLSADIPLATAQSDTAATVEDGGRAAAGGLASESSEPQRAATPSTNVEAPIENSSAGIRREADVRGELRRAALGTRIDREAPAEHFARRQAARAPSASASEPAGHLGQSPPSLPGTDTGDAVRSVGGVPETIADRVDVPGNGDRPGARGPEVAWAVHRLDPEQRGVRGQPRAIDIASDHANEHSAVQRAVAVGDVVGGASPDRAPHSATSASSISRPLATPSLPEPLQPVVDAVVELDRNGGEARIHLDPPELGEVLVRVHRGADGLVIEVRVERPGALQLFVAHRSAFELQLAQRGIALGGLAIDLAGTGGGQSRASDEDPPTRADGTFAELVAGVPSPSALQRRARLAYNPDGRLVLWA